MTAMVILGEASMGSALMQLLLLATVVPFGLLLAPQAVRRDKRTIAALIAAVAILIGAPVYAVICNICEVCNVCAWWWCPLDCWFI